MDIGAPELIIILVIVLLLFGPDRIVRVGHELGTGIREFKQGLQNQPGSSEPEEESPGTKNE